MLPLQFYKTDQKQHSQPVEQAIECEDEKLVGCELLAYNVQNSKHQSSYWMSCFYRLMRNGFRPLTGQCGSTEHQAMHSAALATTENSLAESWRIFHASMVERLSQSLALDPAEN